MDIKNVEVKAICRECKEETKVGTKGVNLKDITIGNKRYTITYIPCKECGKDLVLQVDNEETKRMLLECKRILISKVKAKKKMKHFSDKKNKMLNILQMQLKQRRYDLAESLDGKLYYDVERKKVIDNLDCSYILNSKKGDNNHEK